MVIEFFGNYISKCPNLMKKRAPVPAYILLLSLSNKLKLLVNHLWNTLYKSKMEKGEPKKTSKVLKTNYFKNNFGGKKFQEVNC